MDFGSSSSGFPLENHHHHEYGFRSRNNTNNNNDIDSTTDLEQQQQQQTEMDESSSFFIEKEHMFDKVVTPSDVGKLNRLVIPKQHAEKYFPLDSSSNEKGLLLNFEDRSGKLWRFRYSYWTSSQSYVMTKGWSRFVKEKRLDAGDIVSFHRAVGDDDDDVGKDRFFIDWRRRPPHAAVDTGLAFHHGGLIPHHFQLHQWNPMATPLSIHRDHVNNVGLIHNHNPCYNYPLYRHHNHHDDSIVADESSVYYHLRSVPPSVPVSVVAGGSGGIGRGGGAAKTLRLFGVDMECAVSEARSDDGCNITTSTTTMLPPFRVYDGMPMSMSSRDHDIPTMDFFDKGKSSMSSLDFGT